MRSLCLCLLFLAALLTEACMSGDPNELNGTPILRHRTDHSKALRADADDDDDDDGEETEIRFSDDGSDDDDDVTTESSSKKKKTTGDTATTSADSTEPAPTVTKTVEQQCFEIINKYRAKKGLPALKRWTAKESCGATEASNDSESGQAHGSFGDCGEMAQNECPGYPSSPEENLPECLADMWAEGPGGGHYENMSSREYTMVSCGIHELSDGTFWAVQNFK